MSSINFENNFIFPVVWGRLSFIFLGSAASCSEFAMCVSLEVNKKLGPVGLTCSPVVRNSPQCKACGFTPVQEDCICHGTTRLVYHQLWACTLGSMSCNSWAILEHMLCNPGEATAMRQPSHCKYRVVPFATTRPSSPYSQSKDPP